MPKLGPVPPPPPPVDPFKNQPAPNQVGVVPTNEVTAPVVEQPQPQIGVVTKRPAVVVNVPVKDTTVPLGPVAPAITPAPAAAAAPPTQVGVTKDEAPVFPPPPPEKKPDLGIVKDISITAPPPPPEETIGEPPPKVYQPVVIDPFAKKDE